MKKLFLIPLILSLFMLTGCYDAKDIDDMAYALALGVDKGDKADFEFTFQIAAPLNIKGGVETAFSIEGGENPLINYSVEADDIFEAINKTDDLISKELKLTQLKTVVISEDIVKSDIMPVKKCFDNERMFRDNVYITACTGKARDCLKYAKSPLELNPSKYYELVFSDKFSSRAVSTSLKEFSGKTTFALPCFTTSDSGIKPCGTFIINNKKSVFQLTEEQTFAYNLLDGKITTVHFENALISVKGKPQIITDLENKKCLIEFNVMSQEESGVFQKKNIKRSMEDAGNEILEILKEIKCDPLNIKNSQKKYFLTNKAFSENAVPIEKLDEIKIKINYTLTNKEL